MKMNQISCVVIYVFGLLSLNCGISLVEGCGNRMLQEKTSLDGKKTVTVFERDCGATTDFATIVTLRSNVQKPSADANRIFVVKGQKNVDVEWQDNSLVALYCTSCQVDEIFAQLDSWEGVSIKYK